jgi:hypothetical protein
VAAAPPPPPTAPWSARLWLPGEQERLVAAAVELESAEEARARAAAVLEALLAARPEPPAAPLFPEPVGVAKLLLVEGTAYVDLRPRSGGEPPSSGSSDELMRVYAIVHTLVGNVPEVRQVVLLWNGVQRRGFPGHVDTGRPLVPLPALETP